MSPQKQTILNSAGTGGCMMACYASYLDKNLSELPKIEKFFTAETPENFWWHCVVLFWDLLGYTIHCTTSHEEAIEQSKGDYYFAIGTNPKYPSVKHMCVYKDGKLFHDPHTDDRGLVEEEYFEYVIPSYH